MAHQDIDELLERGYRYALSLVHDESVAEDLLHDAWLAVHERRRLDGRTPEHVGYLFATIRNRFVDRLRRDKRFPHEPLPEEQTSARDLWTSSQHEPEVFDALTLEAALHELRSEEREALFLQAVEGYTIQEIAELSERPVGTVSSLVGRGKKKLREALERLGVVRRNRARSERSSS